MNPEELEQRVARVPLGHPPAAWRAEILSAAREAMPAPPVSPTARTAAPGSHSDGSWWTRWFGPGPAPWTVLAGAGALVISLNWFSAQLGVVTAPEPFRPAFASRGRAVDVARAHQARIAAWAVAESLERDGAEATGIPWPGVISRPRTSVTPVGSLRKYS